MKLIFILTVLIAACNPPVETRVQVKDSIVYKLSPVSDSLLSECVRLNQENDSLKTQLFLSEFRVHKVKYYVAIVDRDPTQIKFLKGWVKRAVQ